MFPEALKVSPVMSGGRVRPAIGSATATPPPVLGVGDTVPLLGPVPWIVTVPPVLVTDPCGFRPRFPLKYTLAPVTEASPFCRSWLPEPITQSPHGPPPPGVSTARATAPTLRPETPPALPTAVSTLRAGTRTRTFVGAVALSNEMHWVVADGTARWPASRHVVQAVAGTDMFAVA